MLKILFRKEISFILKILKTHYDELIQYLEQVAPTTAETIRENNEKQKERKAKMMTHHQEMEEQFKKEREEWEREQASKLHERLQARVVNPCLGLDF